MIVHTAKDVLLEYLRLKFPYKIIFGIESFSVKTHDDEEKITTTFDKYERLESEMSKEDQDAYLPILDSIWRDDELVLIECETIEEAKHLLYNIFNIPGAFIFCPPRQHTIEQYKSRDPEIEKGYYGSFR